VSDIFQLVRNMNIFEISFDLCGIFLDNLVGIWYNTKKFESVYGCFSVCCWRHGDG